MSDLAFSFGKMCVFPPFFGGSNHLSFPPASPLALGCLSVQGLFRRRLETQTKQGHCDREVSVAV